jgi:putative ABC transport system permease protein
MSDLPLILSSLKSRWLNSLLSVFLTAFGVMLVLLILQFGHHIQDRLKADGQGIDIVVGAKGSPLQLILSSVYHIDIPPGNIAYDEAQKWMKHPQVRAAIPLALGDNWRGFRIVGTTPAYMDHYQAQLSQGRVWDKPFEAVAGASVGLALGAEFFGAHGLMAGGHVHEHERYQIIGVMKPTGTVLDRLILTSLDSVLEIHGLEGVEHEHYEHEGYDHSVHEETGEPEVTALLLTTQSPIANINLPRSINRESALQAANPALEMARLTAMLGLGSQSFAALSFVLIAISALSVFAGLAGSLDNRMGDLAVLRAIGYSKRRVFKIITLEGMIIFISGLVLGLVMGLGGFALLAQMIAPLQASGATISLTSDVVWVAVAILLAGLIASIFPALRASRVDVALQLSRSV